MTTQRMSAEQMELLKAVKHQVENYLPEHGYSLAEMWKIVRGDYGAEMQDFWTKMCLEDYKYDMERQASRAKRQLNKGWGTFDICDAETGEIIYILRGRLADYRRYILDNRYYVVSSNVNEYGGTAYVEFE